MNPLTNVKNITKLNEIELSRGLTNKSSWHNIYKESAWIFVGGLSYGLTEGDILTVFSQYGEIVNLNMVRDKKTGKTKGFCFICYANQKSTILSVDNFNGMKLCGRTIRVDHVENYKPPKENEEDDEITKMLYEQGCAPKPIKTEPVEDVNVTRPTEMPQKKRNKMKKKKKHKHSRKSSTSESEGDNTEVVVKKEKLDPGYADTTDIRSDAHISYTKTSRHKSKHDKESDKHSSRSSYRHDRTYDDSNAHKHLKRRHK